MRMGLFNVLKPPGMTSHQVVAFLRRITQTKRVGHAGTLDPQAAGVLPVCVGDATKMIPFLDHHRKIYRVEMLLGITTDTQDTTGKMTAVCKLIPDKEMVEQTLNSFMGDYWQIPPMYSAVKKQGKKLYELARKGETVERVAKRKEIFEINWISMNQDRVRFDVVCSEGTYVRTLCHDVGQKLGCGATMAFLLRLETCRQSVHQAITPDEIGDAVNWETLLIPIDKALSNYPAVHIHNSLHKWLFNGVPIQIDQIDNDRNHFPNQYLRVYTSDCFVGIGHINEAGTHFKMVKLLPETASTVQLSEKQRSR
ncbi:tRNA pseudouridine(55) synthase TruB [Anoxynatronum buryatiense]|uniref:tRNA pseudouridine synthase B n=1 Tax=Anoxynatronum buryatiense TaxID=489973 RepID=A0AA45WUF4_9CLOT|nr:tRNA pseudouridine(55) synthase TruB [Anoxynatronum buryatiense]SMP47668.1 tRNA pseudouridine synthase B [Anoxynatronum buryatiense]